MTPEQLIEFGKDKPETLVDNLNGIYVSAVSVYPVPSIQKEAARRIVQLETELAELRNAAEEIIRIWKGEGRTDMYGKAIENLQDALAVNASV